MHYAQKRYILERSIRVLEGKLRDYRAELATMPPRTRATAGAPRAVRGPGGRCYPSVSAAAQDEGITAPAVAQRCRRPGSGWRYADEGAEVA